MVGRTILVNGLRVHYLSGGSEQSSAVVLLHGYGMDSSVYEPLGQLLSDENFVLIPDLPGFGKSDEVSQTKFEEFAVLLNAFLEEIGVSKVSIIAHSMGGGVSIEFARLFSGKVKKLVLVDSVGAPIKRSTLGWAFAAIRKTYRSLHKPFATAKIVVTFFWNSLRRPIWMLKTFRMTVDCDLLGVLSQLKVQTSVVWANTDEYFPSCASICSALSVDPTMIKGTGHDWIILQPVKASCVLGSML